MKPALILAALLIIAADYAMADLAEGFNEALVATERAEENSNRDAARKPREVLEFVGIEAGMTVLDVAAGAGWYTEVLSAAVGSDGHVISHNSFGYGPRNAATVAAIAQRNGNITMLFAAYGRFRLDAEVDAAITGLNLHDFQNRSAEEAQVFLGATSQAIITSQSSGYRWWTDRRNTVRRNREPKITVDQLNCSFTALSAASMAPST